MRCTLALAVLAAVAVAAHATDDIPLPTAAQLKYMQGEITALTHFNMATFVRDGDPACDKLNWAISGKPATFNPVKLNVSNWIESYQALGAKNAILTAKHGCGFCLWNTSVTLPDGTLFPYAVMRNGGIERDVVQEFSDACKAAGMGHGFYYSTGNSFFLNRINFAVAGPLLPGQANVTDSQFYDIVLAHVTELWTKFGGLEEIWFDHGYGTALKSRVEALLAKYQPQAVGFNGFGIMPSPVKWVGTESGMPQYPIWATGCDGTGNPNSTDFCPIGADTTLQNGDHWFFTPGDGIRTLGELIEVYHDTVGAGCTLELDFAINRDGLVEPAHAARYKEFGDWIRACYDTPVASTSGAGSTFTIQIPSGKSVDRIMLREDMSKGQRIRSYTIEYQASAGASWTPWLSGTSVGNKRIQLGSGPVTAVAIRATIPTSVAEPQLLTFAAFSACPSQ